MDKTLTLIILVVVIAIGAGKPAPKLVTAKIQSAKPSDVGVVVRDYAREHGIEPSIVAAIIKIESNWNMYAKGSSGELGLMQLMPGTARELGVKDRTDPVDNVKGGIRYLAQCKKKHGNKYLRCYNGGPGGVNLAQTKIYEAKVLAAASKIG